MRKQYASKSVLFLMELVVVLLFFAICAAICISVFGSAQQMARDSRDLSNGTMAARSAASCYKSAEGNLEQTMVLLNGQWDERAVVYYDKQWQQVADWDAAGYYLELKPLAQAGAVEIGVHKSADDGLIFTLPVKVGRGGGQHER